MTASAVVVRISATDATVTVPTSPEMRISDLKKALSEQYAFPIKKQKLTVNGKKLKDSQRVCEAMDATEDVIDVSVSVRGGCFGCDCCGCFCCI